MIPAQPKYEKTPVRAKVEAYHCLEKYGIIWVCLGEPVSDLPYLEEFEDAANRPEVAISLAGDAEKSNKIKDGNKENPLNRRFSLCCVSSLDTLDTPMEKRVVVHDSER